MSDKKIRIIAWLDTTNLKKQLAELWKNPQKMKIDLDKTSIEKANINLKNFNTTSNHTNTIWGKIRSTISHTFSAGKIAMTSYLMVLREINKASREAVESINEIDSAITDLSIATGQSRDKTKDMVAGFNSYAKELKATTTDITSAADDWLRAGKSISEVDELVKDSVVLSKLGQISSKEATEDLLATMNGFEMSVEEVGKAIDSMVAIDMKAATSAGDIATALKYCASSADVAGVSFNTLSSYIATVQDKTQQSAEVVGTFFNTVLSRYRNVKIGKFVDDDGEDLSEVESVLNSLGLKLRDTNDEFRSFESIISEVASAWDNYSSVEQSAIAKAFSGTRQQNRWIALMEGYQKTLELTEVAANSAGTALEKYNNSYMDSIEAQRNELKSSFETMVINSDLEQVYTGILKASNSMIDFINKTNALKGALVGLSVAGTIKGFLSLKTGINEAYISLNKFQNAINITKQSTITQRDLSKLRLLTNELSESQLKLIVSSKNLTNKQREQILISAGLTKEEAKLKLQTMGLTTVNNGLTVATTNLKNASLGLWNTLIANPYILITTAISGIVMAYQSYKQEMEEVIQSAKEASNVYRDNVKAVEDYTVRYTELRIALLEAKGDEEATYNVKQQLLELQTELNEKFADELGAINLVTDAYKDQTEAIKNYNKEVANSFLNEERKGIARATKQMMKDRNYVLSMPDISLDSTAGKELKEIVDSYAKEGMYLLEGANGTVQIHLEADAQNAYDTIHSFENDIREKAKELGDEHLFDSILDTSSISLNRAKETLDEYGDIFKQSLMAELVIDDEKSTIYNEALEAVEEYNNAVLNSDDPYSDENVANAKKKLDEVKAKISENTNEWEKYSYITDEVLAQADTRLLEFNQKLQNNKELLADAQSLEGLSDLDVKSLNPEENEAYDRLKESAKEYDLSVEELIDALIRLGIVQGEIQSSEPEITTVTWDASSFSDTIKSYEEGYSKLISAQEEWNNAQSLSAETFADLQENGLLEYIDITSEGLTVNTDKILENAKASKDKAVADLHAAMMSDMLKIALGNVDSVSEEAKSVIAELGNNTETAGQQALNSVSEWATLGATISNVMAQARGEKRGFNGITGEQKAQMESVYNYYTDLADKVSAIDITTPARTGGGNAGKSAADAYVKAFEKELESLEILRDSGEISEKEYLDRLRELYTKYFADRKEYIDELRKYETKYLEGMESLYNSALSGISKLLDKRIDAINKEKDSILEALEEEKEARLEALENQIDDKQAVVDGIQKEIDKMQEANDERKRQINLQKAQYDLERLKNQKTIMSYKNGQVVYENDSREIFEAREQVEDAKFDIEISKKEKEITLIKEEIELLEKQKESVESYYDKMIEQQEKYFDSLIKNLETQKSKWEELADIKEVAEAYSAIEQVFGDLGYTVEDVLNGSSGAFEDFKTKYLSILSEMNSNTSFGEGLTYAVGELDKSLGKLGSNTEGLDTLTSKISEVEDSVTSVSNAISGASGSTGTSGGGKGEESGSTGGTTSSLKKALEEQTTEALTKIDEQSKAFAEGEDSLKGSVEQVISKVAGGSKATEGGGLATGKNGGSAKPGESSGDTSNLMGAIETQTTAALDEEAGIPAQKDAWNELNVPLNTANELVLSIKENLEAMDGKEFTVTLNVNGGGFPSIIGTFANVNGTANVMGSARVHGDWGVKEDTKSLVGELGRELIVRNDKFFTVGNNGAEFVNLKRGDIVFNHRQTEELLKNGKINTRGKAYAQGNYIPLEIADPGKFAMLNKLSRLNDGFILSKNTLDRFNTALDTTVNNINHIKNISNAQDVHISIGDINLSGVQDVNGLANAISTKLPNMLLQTMTKRK